jgi:hypothetical protein
MPVGAVVAGIVLMLQPGCRLIPMRSFDSVNPAGRHIHSPADHRVPARFETVQQVPRVTFSVSFVLPE